MPCGDPGIFSGGVQARRSENSLGNFFFLYSPQLILELRKLYSSKTHITSDFFWGGEGGGTPIPPLDQHLNAQISRPYSRAPDKRE